MALQKAVTKEVLGEELVFENAYHEVVDINGYKQDIVSRIVIFKDATKSIAIDEFHHRFVPDLSEHARNLFAQAYESLKLEPTYFDAIDV